MRKRRLFCRIFATAVLSILVMPMSAQMTDQAAREQVVNTVRSQLHLKNDQFLQVYRDEELEQAFLVAVSKFSRLEFIYKVSQSGDEIKDNVVIPHIFTDIDPTFIIAINPADGNIYRIHGFADSQNEFEKLILAAKVKILSPDQAQAISDFYREVNPGHYSLTTLKPILTLLELKQAAECQCQGSETSFDKGEKAFDDWWKHAKRLYKDISFMETAAPQGTGYLVRWIVLSSPGPGNCGGAPLRAQLEVSSDGHIGKMTFFRFREQVGDWVTHP